MVVSLAVASLLVQLTLSSPSVCPDDYLYFKETNRCFKLYEEPTTFEDAKSICNSDNASLVSIHSRKENDFLAAIDLVTPFTSACAPVTTMSTIFNGSMVLPSFLQHGAQTSPRIIGTFVQKRGRIVQVVEACTVIDTEWSDYKKAWSIVRCHFTLGFICKQKSSSANISTPCPSDDYSFFKPKRSCYRIDLNEKKFIGAEEECTKTGGHLASVHTQEENDFVSDLFRRVGSPLFIGLKRDPHGNFEWTDGTSANFTAWGITQPALKPDENCVILIGASEIPKYRRTWENKLCFSSSFICASNAVIPISSNTSNRSPWIIIIAAVIAILLLFVLVGIFLVLRRRQKASSSVPRQLHRLSEIRRHPASKTDGENAKEPNIDDLYSDIRALSVTNFDSRFLIPYSRIGRVENVLGTGNFGMVYRSNYQKNRPPNESLVVACKQLHSLDDEEKRTEFLLEATIMMSLKHTHVVSLHGVAFNDEKVPILVMELLSGGSLYGFLRNNETVESERLRFGKEIASGMLYLHNCNLIHRDLATRNCMFVEENGRIEKTEFRLTADRLLKITDFGLAREFQEQYTFQHKRPLPWRWTAPEAYFQQSVTTKGDVWSYGVTLWEIYTQAELPYKEIGDPHEYFKALKKGSRLHRPMEYTSVLRPCWALEPEERPDFGDIFVDISKRHKGSLKAVEEAPKDPQAHAGRDPNLPPATTSEKAASPSVHDDYEIPNGN